MIVLPTMKEITVDGKTVRYTMGGPGHIEAERPSSFGTPGFVFSEFIDEKIGRAIAAKERKNFEKHRNFGNTYPWGRVF